MKSDTTSPQTTIDVRRIPPDVRHALIFDTFEQLLAGQVLMIVSDHDPQPLRRAFGARYGDRVSAEYVESGPEVWRVQFRKRASDGCCGGNCGG